MAWRVREEEKVERKREERGKKEVEKRRERETEGGQLQGTVVRMVYW